MITDQELEDIGFKNDGFTKSQYTGRLCKYHLEKDNGHIIPKHDTLDVFLYIDQPFFTLTIEHQSSWSNTKEKVFKGRCEDIEFLK